MFSYIRRLRVIFWGFKILIFNIFWVFRKMNIFGVRYEDCIFLGSSQNCSIFRGHFYTFQGLFFRSRHRMGDNFLGCLNFKYFFWGVLEIPDIFWGEW